MSQARMNSNTGTTGTVTVSSTPIPTYKGVGWVDISLQAAALTAGWTFVTLPDDRGNPTNTRSAQVYASSAAKIGGVILDSVGGGYLARAGIIDGGRPEYGVTSIYDSADGFYLGPENLLVQLAPVVGYVVVNQRFLNGLAIGPFAGVPINLATPFLGAIRDSPKIGLQYN